MQEPSLTDSLGEPIHKRLFDAELRRIDERHHTFVQTVDATIAALRDEGRASATAADKAVQAALAAAKEAVQKAETSADKRFDAVNEFRATLSDQTATFIPRAEAEAAIRQNAKDIGELKDRFNTMTGAEGGKRTEVADSRANTGTLIGLGGVFLAFVGVAIAVVVALLK